MAAVLTYHMTRPCGRTADSCIECTTSYSVTATAAINCTGTPPATICVQPRLAGFIDATGCGEPDCGETMPEQWIVVIEWPTLTDTPGFPYTLTNTTAGSISLIGNTIVAPGGFGVCGVDGCGLMIAFHSEIYPLYDAEEAAWPSRDFVLCLPMGSFHGPVYLRDQPTETYLGVFGPAIDRRRLVDPDSGFGTLCTDHNHGGTFTYIPPELPFGGGPYPSLPITVSIYPRVAGG